MRKTIGVSSALVVLAVLGASQASSAVASTTPRWTTHVRNYPGGISNGVRAYLDSGVSSATSRSRRRYPVGVARHGAAQQPAGQQPRLEPTGPAERDPGRGQPESTRMIAVAAANDYVNGGSQIYRTTDGGFSTGPLSSAPRRPETGDFCGGGGDPALTYSKRDHAFYFAATLLLPRFHRRPRSR